VNPEPADHQGLAAAIVLDAVLVNPWASEHLVREVLTGQCHR
jgi:hypothetical protein